MALRKASAYSRMKARPYTRKSAVKAKSYIRTIPPQKISKFQMGDKKGYEAGKLKFVTNILSGEDIMIRDNAIEAARQYVHKILEENVNGQYYMEVKVAPHHILRENKMLTGAGADRMQTGMQLSFGKTIGRAAQVKKNQSIFFVAALTDKGRRTAMEAFGRVKAKLPGHCKLSMENLKF